MNSYFQIIALLLMVNIGFSQKRATLECGYFGKKTIEQRNKIFPFSEAKKVILVAYPSPYSIIIGEDGKHITIDSLYLSPQFKVIKHIDLPQSATQYFITEKIELNPTQINELSNLLVNYKIKKNNQNIGIVSIGCYEPRNAILFTDENDKVISTIEICFQCDQFYQLPEETIPNFNTLCKIEECFGMVNLIKDFFQKTGIQYGVVRE